MNKNIKAKWLKKLRDPATKQGFGRLFDHEGKSCALGVLCEVLVSEGLAAKFVNPATGSYSIGAPRGRLRLYSTVPRSLRRRISLSDDATQKLIGLNDCHRKSFNEIADYVEAAL